MDKPNAELVARAQQAGHGAFRCYFPFAANTRDRLLGRVVVATSLTCLLFLGTVAGATGWID